MKILATSVESPVLYELRFGGAERMQDRWNKISC